MKLREYFLCAKKTQIMTLINNLFSSVSVFDERSREYYDACVCIPLLVNKVQCRGILVMYITTKMSVTTSFIL